MGHDLVAIDHFTSFGVFHKYVADLTVFSDAFLQSVLHLLTPLFHSGPFSSFNSTGSAQILGS